MYLSLLGYDVTAVDGSSVGLEKAACLAAENNITIKTVYTDLSDWNAKPCSWDGIIAIFCHTEPELRIELFRNCVNGLKRNGVFILEAYSKNQLDHNSGGPRNSDLLRSLSELRAELNGLKFRLVKELTRNIQEGVLHSGAGAVVQIIGMKV